MAPRPDAPEIDEQLGFIRGWAAVLDELVETAIGPDARESPQPRGIAALR